MTRTRTAPMNVNTKSNPLPGQYRDCVRFGIVDSLASATYDGVFWNVIPDEDSEALVKVREIETFPVVVGDWIAFVAFYEGGFVAIPIET